MMKNNCVWTYLFFAKILFSSPKASETQIERYNTQYLSVFLKIRVLEALPQTIDELIINTIALQMIKEQGITNKIYSVIYCQTLKQNEINDLLKSACTYKPSVMSNSLATENQSVLS
ncbi:hypothetical protein JF541_19405 [Marinobacter hydrocarbonoclasticus]|uniref:hypothetical protein n=1 Tax=Marinobacter nauticus TaxID=2743 RepID=UPI001A8FBF3B|nr:hypothetical protein [Marinobacter nauticus]MBN8241326.1 hypothetical protein [Marinobacter nauticus]